MSTSTTTRDQARLIRVWDPFVRLFHWSVVAGFFIAYFTEDDFLTLHVWAGYTVGGMVALRIVWGFVGPRHARFTDFIHGPFKAWSYLKELIAFRAPRYIGHSPAGGAMVLMLIAGLLATVWTGLDLQAVENNAGPLAVLSSEAHASTGTDAHAIQIAGKDNGEGYGESLWGDLHEGLATFTFVLVLLHIGGVAWASVAHRENLCHAMVTGLKRAPE